MPTLSTETQATLAREARNAARNVAKSRPWLDPADLEQEAWAAMLGKLGDYRPDAGPLGAFAGRVALVACKRLAIKIGAIATVPRREALAGEIARQRGLRVGEAVLEKQADDAPLPDVAVSQREEQAQLASVVAEYLAAGREGDAIRAVLTGALKSKEAAARHDVQTAWLYQATHEAKKAMRADKRLREFAS